MSVINAATLLLRFGLAGLVSVCLLASTAQAHRVVIDGITTTQFNGQPGVTDDPGNFTLYHYGEVYQSANVNLGFTAGSSAQLTVYDNGLIVLGGPLTSFPADASNLAAYGRDVLTPALGTASAPTDAGSFVYAAASGAQSNTLSRPDLGNLFRVAYSIGGVPVQMNLYQLTDAPGDFILEYLQGATDSNGDPTGGSLAADTLIGYDIKGHLLIEPASRTDADTEQYLFAAAAPEPGTWAMMLGGAALVGGALRRRRAYDRRRLATA